MNSFYLYYSAKSQVCWCSDANSGDFHQGIRAFITRAKVAHESPWPFTFPTALLISGGHFTNLLIPGSTMSK